MVHHLGFTRDDVYKMATNERRGHLYRFSAEIEKKQEMMEEARANSNGSGKNTKRISGEALKSKMRSGEIN